MNSYTLIDTIKLKGKCRLTKGGGSLFQYCDRPVDNNAGRIKFPKPLNQTSYRSGRSEVAELILSQQFNGEVRVYSHKDFIAEYGYGIFIQNIPPWLLYGSSLPKKTKKMQDAMSGAPIWVEVSIPSLADLENMTPFIDYMTTHATSLNKSEAIWGYINHHNPFSKYGIQV